MDRNPVRQSCSHCREIRSGGLVAAADINYYVNLSGREFSYHLKDIIDKMESMENVIKRCRH